MICIRPFLVLGVEHFYLLADSALQLGSFCVLCLCPCRSYGGCEYHRCTRYSTKTYKHSEPGMKSFHACQIIGWICPAALLASALYFTGVSYRFGDTCHINHSNSMADFWGWILGLTGATIIVQICTMIYCLKVYLTNYFSSYDESEDESLDITPEMFKEKSSLSQSSASFQSQGSNKKATVSPAMAIIIISGSFA